MGEFVQACLFDWAQGAQQPKDRLATVLGLDAHLRALASLSQLLFAPLERQAIVEELVGDMFYGWTYIVSWGAARGPVKLGYTKNMDHRFSNYLVHNPGPLHLWGVAHGGTGVEARLHWALSDYRLCRRREWLDLSRGSIEEELKTLASVVWTDRAFWGRGGGQ